MFTITLVQGLNRQIRRMCEYFGYEVTQLVRTRIMNVSLQGLALGDWRDLTPKEIDTIVALTESSEAVPEKRQTARPDYNSGAGANKPKKTATKARQKQERQKQERQKPAKLGAKTVGNKPPPKGKRTASGKVRTGPKASASGKPQPRGKTAGAGKNAKAGAKPVGKGRVGRPKGKR